MLDRIERQDWDNAIRLAVVLFICALLAALLFFWGIGTLKNDAALSVPAPTTDSTLAEGSGESNTLFQVANGTKKTGFAGEATQFLASDERTARQPVTSEEKVKETIIYYKPDSATYEERKDDAFEMASQLGVSSDGVEPFSEDLTVGVQFDKSVDILVILGEDASVTASAAEPSS